MNLLTSVFVNSTGLIFDIVGALALWKFGLPEALDRGGRDFITTRNVDQTAIAKAKSYDRFSKLGLFFLVAGFLLQLISNFIPN